MEPHKSAVRTVQEDDGMASYGMHPRVHEQLVRCHNPALFGRDPVAETHERIRRLMREAVSIPDNQDGVTLSA